MEEIAKLLPHIPDQWTAFNTVDWNDKSILAYHVDTRDFHVLCAKEVSELRQNQIDERTISKPEYKNKFYFTSEEVQILIKKLFDESGGSKEWRCLSFKGERSGWCKYIRIYRREDLFLVGHGRQENWRAENKEFWNQEQNEQY